MGHTIGLHLDLTWEPDMPWEDIAVFSFVPEKKKSLRLLPASSRARSSRSIIPTASLAVSWKIGNISRGQKLTEDLLCVGPPLRQRPLCAIVADHSADCHGVCPRMTPEHSRKMLSAHTSGLAARCAIVSSRDLTLRGARASVAGHGRTRVGGSRRAARDGEGSFGWLGYGREIPVEI